MEEKILTECGCLGEGEEYGNREREEIVKQPQPQHQQEKE